MKNKKRKLNKSFFIGSLIGIGIGIATMTSFLNSNTVEVKVLHQVKPNETLWGICQNYYNENNLSNDVYFLQFMYDVEQENAWLKDANYKLKPNDVVTISYKKRTPRVRD